ncbi:hypothetical protein I4U23_023788 [Adineta vaga]|nr:hypothetical protein I4U23_023788 [Adineta vaga]
MDQTELSTIDTNQSGFIRKKSSFLRDGSYRIFHITKQPNETDDDQEQNKNTEETLENNQLQEKSVKLPSQNSLKQLLLQATSCETKSMEMKISPTSSHQSMNDFSPGILCADAASMNLLEKNKQDIMVKVLDETTRRSTLFARSDKFESPNRKQVLINTHPELQASFHRRRQRFLVACGTVTIALTVIVTITIYVIVMTAKYVAHMNLSAAHRQPLI